MWKEVRRGGRLGTKKCRAFIDLSVSLWSYGVGGGVL